MSTIPSDPVILYSWVNTQLRDNYESLDELCEDMGIDRSEMETKLLNAGFVYQPELNQFR